MHAWRTLLRAALWGHAQCRMPMGVWAHADATGVPLPVRAVARPDGVLWRHIMGTVGRISGPLALRLAQWVRLAELS